MISFEFEHQGKRVLAQSEWVGETLWVHFDGRCFPYAGEKQLSDRKAKGRAGVAGDLHAPMPGKITKILCQNGDQVKKGQALVVMEAMKMEYTLKAEGDATILDAVVTAGEQVSLGKTLVKMKAQG